MIGKELRRQVEFELDPERMLKFRRMERAFLEEIV